MQRVGEYRAYQLYELSQEERDRTGSGNSRYVRNSIIVFCPDSRAVSLGNEWGSYEKLQDAKAAIDKECAMATEKKPMKEQLQTAAEKSRAAAAVTEHERFTAAEEIERRRRERMRQGYVSEREKTGDY